MRREETTLYADLVLSYLGRTKEFDPSQARDESGKWTGGGSGGESSGGGNGGGDGGVSGGGSEEPIFGNASSSARRSRQSLERQNAREMLNKFDETSRKGGANAKIYASRARDAIATAYHDLAGKYVIRDFATEPQVTKANKLIDMGHAEAIFGKGRALLK